MRKLRLVIEFIVSHWSIEQRSRLVLFIGKLLEVVVETHGEASVLAHPLVAVVRRDAKVAAPHLLVHVGVSQQVQFTILFQMLHRIVGFIFGVHFCERRLLHYDIIVPVLKLVALLLSPHPL